MARDVGDEGRAREALDILGLSPNAELVEFSIRLPRDLHEKVRLRAMAVGQSNAVYIRGLIYRECQGDPEEKFVDQLMEWWVYRGQGDRQQLIGAKARAEAIRMTFSRKLRMVIKQFLDHGLL